MYALTDLPANRTVLVGALTAPSDSKWNDKYYGIGKGMKGNGTSDTRKIFIFATRTTTYDQPYVWKSDRGLSLRNGRREHGERGRLANGLWNANTHIQT
jgi:hypothetical protein